MVPIRLLTIAGAVRGALAAMVGLGLVLSALLMTQALAMSHLFTAILEGQDFTKYQFSIVVVAATLVLRPGMVAVRELVAHQCGSVLKRTLRDRIIAADQLAGPFASAERQGARHGLLTDGIENLDPYVTRYLPQVVITATTVVAAAIVLCLIDPVVGLVAVVLAAMVPIVPRLWDKAMARTGSDHWQKYSSVHADVVDSMRGMETLKLLDAVDGRRRHLVAASDGLLLATLNQLRVSLLESGLTGFLVVAGPAAALVTGVVRVESSALAAASIFAVTFVSIEMFRPFRDLSAHWHAGYLGLAAGTRIVSALLEPHPTKLPVPMPVDEGNAIEFDDVSARYPGSQVDSLRGVTVSIARGEKVAVVGASGSGKSTFVNVVAALLPPTAGSAAVNQRQDGPDLAIVSQDTVLFAGSVADNLLLVSPAATDDELAKAIERAEATDILTHGLATEVGDRGALLSGGQRQRLALARAFLIPATILILDEATSALDSRREARVISSVLDAGSDVTAIIVAHRLSSIAGVDRILVFDDAQLVESGTWSELIEAKGTFAALWAAQNDTVVA